MLRLTPTAASSYIGDLSSKYRINFMDSTTLTQQLTDLEVGQALGISRSSVWRWSKSGRIPAPRKIGANTSRWDSREVQAAIQKIAA
jgi:predicted DNA-binding transcriptional regulator AlpA